MFDLSGIKLSTSAKKAQPAPRKAPLIPAQRTTSREGAMANLRQAMSGLGGHMVTPASPSMDR